MGEVAVLILKWAVRASIIIVGIIAFITLYNFAISFFLVSLAGNVITDILAFVQVWLPFNLNVVLTWIFTAASLYLFYRVMIFAIGYMNRFVGNN